MAGSALVRWMAAKRDELGLTNGRFAALLGISLPLWRFYRLGTRRPSIRMLRRLLERFPGDRDAILAAMEAAPDPDEGNGDG